MALTEGEAGEAYSLLVRVVNQQGLDWVVTQAEFQIALGKIRTGKVLSKEVPLRGSSMEQVDRMSKGRPAKFTLSDEYSDSEKLKILIVALENAVCGVWRTASAVSEFMTENIPNLSGVKFLPEGISREPFTLDAREIHAHKQSVERLEALILELKEAI